MKKMQVSEKIKMVSIQDKKYDAKLIHYYLITEDGNKYYVFSKKYTKTAYDLCKAGIRMNALLEYKSKHTDIMNLVNYVRRLLPCLVDEYELKVFA